MDRRTFLASTSAVLLATPLVAEVQQAGKTARMGFLRFGPQPSPEVLAQISRTAFWQGMRELGWVEGQNLMVEWRFGDPANQFQAAAAELVALKVDVIVTFGGRPAALAAKEATRTIPIVFTGVPDPVESGLVSSLARPGGNATGLSSRVTTVDLFGKRLELLKLAVPEVSRIGVLRHPGQASENTERDIQQKAEVWTGQLGVRPYFVDAREPSEFDRAFSDMLKARADALTVMGSTTFYNERRRLVNLAAKNRLPAVYPWREAVDAGGLMSYGPDLTNFNRRAATYVDKIFKGAKPADLPVEQPTKFELVINLKTAKALGLTIPPSLLGRADEVIR